MVKLYLQRCLQAKLPLFMLPILITLTCFSYYTTYLEQQEWEHVLQSKASDANLSVVAKLLEGYNGSLFFERFLFSDQYSAIAILVLLLGFGITFNARLFNDVASNYGTLLVSRTSYARYLASVLTAQAIYMFVYIVLFFAMTFSVTLLIFSGGFTVSSASFAHNLSYLHYFGLIVFSVIHTALYVVTLITFTSLCTLFVNHQYALQALPFVITMGSYILGFTLGNVNDFFANVTLLFIFNRFLFSVNRLFITTESLLSFSITSFTFIALLAIAIFILYKLNLKKFGRDYVHG